MANFGALWVSDYSGTVPNRTSNLDEARKSANYFRHVLSGQEALVRGDGAAFPNPPLHCIATRPAPTTTLREADLAQSTKVPEAVEGVALAYYAGHGSTEGLLLNLPSSNPAHVVEPSEIQWGQWQLRWVCLDACDTLNQAGVATRWRHSFTGLHGMLGWHVSPAPQIPRGLLLAWYLNQGETLTDAWARACEESESEFTAWASLRATTTPGLVTGEFWPLEGKSSAALNLETNKEYVYIRAGDAEPRPTSPSVPAPLGSAPTLPPPPPLFPWNITNQNALVDRAMEYARSLGWKPSAPVAYRVCDETREYWFRVRMQATDPTNGATGRLDVFPPTGAVRWVRDGWGIGGPSNVAAAAAWTASVTKKQLLDKANSFLHQHALLRDIGAATFSRKFDFVTLSQQFNFKGGALGRSKILARHVWYRKRDAAGPLSHIVVTLAPDLSVLACYRALPCWQAPFTRAPSVSREHARDALVRHLKSLGADPSIADFPAVLEWYSGGPGIRQDAPIPVYTFEGFISDGRRNIPRLFHVAAVPLDVLVKDQYAYSLLDSLVFPSP